MDSLTSPSSRPARTFIRSSMDRIRRSFRNSFRRRSGSGSLSERHISTTGGNSSGNEDTSKPPIWSQDEASVRAGTCSFKVKYLGSVEVYESRGMQVCEEALKVLRASRKRPVKGILYITGDSLRVVDKDNKGLVVDQTIEKVSFCAPDRQHEKGFAYICRDGTTRRWMCYGFHVRKTTGERLSHAVGCAFAVCLEKKQKRDREAQRLQPLAHQPDYSATTFPKGDVSAEAECNVSEKSYSNSTAFQRNSFRYASLQERLQDPQNVKPSEKVPLKQAVNPHAVARPHGNRDLFERQGSLRMPSQATAPNVVDPGKDKATDETNFRRFNSLRLNQLPSNLARQEASFAFGKSPIAEECSSPNPSVANSGQQNNLPHASPSSSGLSSPSSGALSSSPLDLVRNSQSNASASSVNYSRGEEWLQTTASQTKFWQQYRGISPPTVANNNNQPSSTPVAENGRHQPPSFPPPPLPSGISAGKQQSSTTKQHVVRNQTPEAQADRSKMWTTFDDHWNSIQSPSKEIASETSFESSPSFSPTNPFNQESTAVKI